MKRTQPKRDWRAARAKVEREGVCRVCGFGMVEGLEAAHVVGRVHDKPRSAYDHGDKFGGGGTLYVHPDSIVPLCRGVLTAGCHGKYDRHELDLLPYLTRDEKRQALEDFDYEVFAYLKRVCGVGFVPEEATQ